MRNLNVTKRLPLICVALIGAIALASVAALPAAAQSDDEKIGAEVAEQVEALIGIYEMPGTSDYVAAIGSRLAGNLEDNPFTFKFAIVDQFEPNAFALPGGWVYISRALLVLANNEDELAGVIGHEITHVTERHSAKRQRRGILGGVLQIPGAIIGSVVDEDLGRLLNAPIAAVNQLGLATYSRGQENEADKLGMRLSAKSGYDPTALADILSHLEADVEMLTGEKRKATFFDSHPTTPDRVKNINKEAEKIEWSRQKPIASERREFLRKLDGIWYDQNPAAGIFKDEHFYQADMGFTLTFPKGWTSLNTPQHVGAYADEEKAVVFVAVAGDEDPTAYAAEFEERLRKEHGVSPLKSHAVEGDKWKGYHVSLEEEGQRGGERSYLHYLWAKMGGVTYQLVAAGADRYREALRETALSLRPLAKKDWESIAALRVRIIEARDDENLTQLGKRTGNRWTPAYTAVVNDLAVDQKLEAGTLVKITRREQYKSR